MEKDKNESEISGAEKIYSEKNDVENNENNEKVEKKVKRDTVFYYSRERRLDRASALVRGNSDNNGQTTKKIPLSKIFVTRGNTIFFIIIIIVCFVLGITNRLNVTERNVKLGGNIVTAEITSEEGILILDLEKNLPKRGEAYTGAVEIYVSPVLPKPKDGEEHELPPVFSHRVFFGAYSKETFSISIPFTQAEYFVIFRTSDEHKTMRLKVIEAN